MQFTNAVMHVVSNSPAITKELLAVYPAVNGYIVYMHDPCKYGVPQGLDSLGQHACATCTNKISGIPRLKQKS